MTWQNIYFAQYPHLKPHTPVLPSRMIFCPAVTAPMGACKAPGGRSIGHTAGQLACGVLAGTK